MGETFARMAEVVFPGVDQAFSYLVPEQLARNARPGMRVLAPFGRRCLTGTIVGIDDVANQRATREIECLLDQQPAFSAGLLKFTRWIADYYLSPWGDVLKAALPAGISLDEKHHWTSAGDDDPRLADVIRENPALEPLFEAMKAGPLSAERMRSEFGFGRTAKALRTLEADGLIAYRPILRPPRVKARLDSIVALADNVRAEYGPELFVHIRSVHEQHLLKEVFESGSEGILKSELLKGAGSGRRQAFARMVEAGSVILRAETVSRWNPSAETVPETHEPEQLTDEQTTAVAAISNAIERGAFTPFVLFGVTGSGKTQVYIEAIRRALAANKTALVLLPEIALTPFVWGRFYRAFGDRVAIQHSAQSPAVRYDLWRDIKNGRYPVVVGARSAVFAPLERLGIIVVDEEQESSFKQEDPVPRYQARDAALVRARHENAAIVLGSATPSAETLHHAMAGKYQLLRLPYRVGGAVPPRVEIIQRVRPVPVEETSSGEKGTEKKRTSRTLELPLFTDELLSRIGETLARNRQIILLQNRRGYSPFLICAECGWIPMCPDCSVSLTYHRRGVALRCHYCDHREAAPDACPRCACPEWLTQGYGTQRLEEEIAAHFPKARLLRMDSDTVARQGMHGKMITAFAAGEYDVLIGTQMVAKGLDFPNVELAAVVQADAELFYPDFRASERAASLIMQVAGRAGRRTEPGAVVIQSSVVDHPVLNNILKNDWQQFVREELSNREQGGFPPFTRLILLRSSGKNESAAARALLRMRRTLQKDSRILALGPAPAVIAKIKNVFRFHLLVRSARDDDPKGNRLREAIDNALEEYKANRPEAGITIDVDVDPQTVI